MWLTAATAPESYSRVAYLKLERDCVTSNNPKTGGPTRDRTYQAYDEKDEAIGATITERVLAESGGLSTVIGSPDSASSTGVFRDQVGLLNSPLVTNTVTNYQYFVTTIPGTPWINVPTEVRTPYGFYGPNSPASVNMVFAVTMTHKYIGNQNTFDVTYNGDAGMAGLPKCGK